MTKYAGLLDMDMLKVMYDTLYKFAYNLVEEHNPCKITIKDNKVTCFGGRDNWSNSYKNSLCCSGSCKYLGPKGCLTKNLRCKTFFCMQAIENLPDSVLIKLDTVCIIGWELRLMQAWDSRASIIKSASKSFEENLHQEPPGITHFGMPDFKCGYFYNKKLNMIAKRTGIAAYELNKKI